MVKSKYNLSMIIVLTIYPIPFLFLFITSLSQFLFSYNIVNIDNRIHSFSQVCSTIILFFILSFISVLITILNTVTVSIDSFAKTIEFKNFYTRKSYCYNFSDLDGYVDTYYYLNGPKVYNIIYLIKQGKRIRKISSNFYSNYDELLLEIKNIEYLGYREFKQIKDFKILFGQEVSD